MVKFFYASLVTTLFNIGFVAVLQLLIHFTDKNNIGHNKYLWHYEIVYATYSTILSALLLWLGANGLGTFTADLLISLQFLTLTGLTSVLITLRTILIATAANFLLFIIANGGLNLPLGIFIAFTFLLLILERHFLYPIDGHRPSRVFVNILISSGLWLYMYVANRADFQNAIIFSLTCIMANILTYFYTNLLRQDHKKKVKIEIEATFDDLTGARNWRTFEMDLQHQYQLHNNNQQLSLVSFDIDHFKAINDSYGHETGNVALSTLSHAIQHVLNKNGLGNNLYRTGGEEFCILIPESSSEHANDIAEQCLNKLHALQIPNQIGEKFGLTISLGVSQLYQEDTGGETLFERVDKNLYHSKQNGRNQITAE